LTKENKSRSGNRKKRRGDNKRDNTKPLPNEIEVDDSKPSSEELTKMKKSELVEICTRMEIKKSGTKDELIEQRYKKFRVLGKFIEANNIEEIYSEIPQKTEKIETSFYNRCNERYW